MQDKMNLQQHSVRRLGSKHWMLIICLLGLICGCHTLSKVEREMFQQSTEALCTGVVKAYKAHDLKAFTELAISRKQLGEMMKGANLPSTAKRENISKMSSGEFAAMVQDSLGKVLDKCGIEWPKANFEKFTSSRRAVEIAQGFKMILGKLYIQQGDAHFVQSVTIVEAGTGKFFMGDFSEILPDK